MKKYLRILLPILLTSVGSFLLIKFGKVNYETLNLPKFAPQKFVFSIAWTLIYILMYLSVRPCVENKKIIFLYDCLLFSHGLWVFLFFFLGYSLISLILLLILYFLSWVFVYYLYNFKKSSFYLNVFYLVWLLIAIYLNIGVVILN